MVINDTSHSSVATWFRSGGIKIPTLLITLLHYFVMHR